MDENVFDMHLPLLLPDEMSAKYWENEEWLAKTIKLIRTLLDVYVSADEYDVPQPRRDVMTTMLRYCTMFQWHPGHTKEIHAAAFGSLLSNSQFLSLPNQCNSGHLESKEGS